MGGNINMYSLLQSCPRDQAQSQPALRYGIFFFCCWRSLWILTLTFPFYVHVIKWIFIQPSQISITTDTDRRNRQLVICDFAACLSCIYPLILIYLEWSWYHLSCHLIRNLEPFWNNSWWNKVTVKMPRSCFHRLMASVSHFQALQRWSSSCPTNWEEWQNIPKIQLCEARGIRSKNIRRCNFCHANRAWMLSAKCYAICEFYGISQRCCHHFNYFQEFQTFFTDSLFHRFHPKRLWTGLGIT